MPKAKDTADAERAARRRRLEALREDCGRHLDGCVRIKLVEDGACPSLAVSTRWACGILKDGRKVEMALLGSSREAEDRARALLHRLGEMLDEPPDEDGATSDFARDPDLRAMLVLAMRAKGRTSWTGSKDGLHFPPMPDGEVRPESLETAWRDAGMIRQTEREVPDARAAIAELCAELLEVKPSASPRRERRTDDQKFNQASSALLQEYERSGVMLRQNQVAARIGMSEEELSKLVGKSGKKGEKWRRLKQTLVSGRPGRATQGGDDEGE